MDWTACARCGGGPGLWYVFDSQSDQSHCSCGWVVWRWRRKHVAALDGTSLSGMGPGRHVVQWDDSVHEATPLFKAKASPLNPPAWRPRLPAILPEDEDLKVRPLVPLDLDGQPMATTPGRQDAQRQGAYTGQSDSFEGPGLQGSGMEPGLHTVLWDDNGEPTVGYPVQFASGPTRRLKPEPRDPADYPDSMRIRLYMILPMILPGFKPAGDESIEEVGPDIHYVTLPWRQALAWYREMERAMGGDR